MACSLKERTPPPLNTWGGGSRMRFVREFMSSRIPPPSPPLPPHRMQLVGEVVSRQGPDLRHMSKTGVWQGLGWGGVGVGGVLDDAGAAAGSNEGSKHERIAPKVARVGPAPRLGSGGIAAHFCRRSSVTGHRPAYWSVGPQRRRRRLPRGGCELARTHARTRTRARTHTHTRMCGEAREWQAQTGDSEGVVRRGADGCPLRHVGHSIPPTGSS